VFGGARDRDQAAKVFDVAKRMVELSPVLQRRLKIYKLPRRIIDEHTASSFETIAGDSAGNLGHNPHGAILDEVLAQRDAGLWTALRTAQGARLQPLLAAATTAGDDPNSFGKAEHDEMVRILEDPKRAPHIFAYIRSLPADADPWDEANWYHSNPALGDFLSIESLREEAQEARNDPAKENGFRQFRLNQWVSQSVRWMPMHIWDNNVGDQPNLGLWPTPDWGRKHLLKRTAYAGLDLAAKFDLTAWGLLIPGDEDDDPVHALWRFWIPEDGLEKLDKFHSNRFSMWARQGWITVTEGSVLDYERVIADIKIDAADFAVASVDADEWSMWPIIANVADACGLSIDRGEVTAYRNTYDRLSAGMDDVMALCKEQRLAHHGNPVAKFCFGNVQVKRAPYDANLLRPVKPDRSTDRTRIDAVPTLAMAANGLRAARAKRGRISPYEKNKLMVV
jgi:phage terminase large subunit-like protein